MRVELRTQLTSNIPDTIIIPCPKNTPFPAEWAGGLSAAGLSPALVAEDFSADLKEVFTLFLNLGGAPKRICLVGLGDDPGLPQALSALRSFIFRQRTKLPAKTALYLTHLGDGAAFPMRLLEGALNGVLLGRYQIGSMKTEEKTSAPFFEESAVLEVFLPENLHTQAIALVDRARHIAETQLEIFDLVNKPSNLITPQALAAWAVHAGAARNFHVRVLDKPTLEAEGFHALLAVNRGSVDPAVFIVMDYQPAGQQALGTICLVGKGVTFDTGGLSIKPSSNMHYMKSDMGGAAAVMGAVECAAKLNLPIRVIGLIPSTDNSVDGHSLKPNEIISSYSGKTIEVIDTDAEGRLILADGLSYAVRNYRPDVLIDMATLTGSTIRTLGYAAGGLFCNDPILTENLIRAGEASGERLWPLPIWDDFKDGIKSDIADVKNLSSKPTAGAIYAAKFLEVFIDKHPSWAHLDIAGVAVTDSEFAAQKSATAYGVRLMVEFFESWIAKKTAKAN
jgi:leucyl aminopeptidase